MVSDTIIRRVEEDFRNSFSRIVSKNTDFAKIARDFVSAERAEEELRRIDGIVPCRGKKLLELGSGHGMLLVVARQRFECDAFGVEPAEQFSGVYETSRDLLREAGVDESIVKQGSAENLPYPDDSFDIVYSSNVLEHVRDPAAVLAESVRVLRPGGHLVFVIPNYGSFWEGHYGMIVLPHAPRRLLRLIVRLRGRDPSFIDTLQLVTHGRLRRWLSGVKDQLTVLDWGQDLWASRVRSLNFSEWALLGRLKRMVRIVHRLRLVEPVILLGRVLHWETPFFLVCRKKNDSSQLPAKGET